MSVVSLLSDLFSDLSGEPYKSHVLAAGANTDLISCWMMISVQGKRLDRVKKSEIVRSMTIS